MKGFTSLQTLIVVLILSILFLSILLALNPQEFLAKRNDAKVLKNISKNQITTPERLYSRKSNANCPEGTFAWGYYSIEEDSIKTLCK